MTTDLKRLGKHGSYRLGQLRTQGVHQHAAPAPFRPSFARSTRRGPVSVWLAALALGVLLVAGGAHAGWWFVPFLVGLAGGLINRIAGWRARIAVSAIALIALLGWGIPLIVHALGGQAYGSVAREIAALGGLPGSAVVGVAVTLLLALVQALVGYWLGRALTPRPADDLTSASGGPRSGPSPANRPAVERVCGVAVARAGVRRVLSDSNATHPPADGARRLLCWLPARAGRVRAIALLSSRQVRLPSDGLAAPAWS